MPPREYGKNVTMLEDLPELSDLQPPSYTGARHLPVTEADRYKKFIRDGHVPPSESGMFPKIPQTPQPPPPPFMMDGDVSQYAMGDIKSKYNMSGSPSCLEVADHIANCPICSKFYNTDKTMYIVVIVLLALICIILLKKVLNV